MWMDFYAAFKHLLSGDILKASIIYDRFSSVVPTFFGLLLPRKLNIHCRFQHENMLFFSRKRRRENVD